MNNNLAFYENCIWVCVYGWKSRISASLLSFLAFHNGTRMSQSHLDEKEMNDMVSVGRRSWWIQFYFSFLFDEKKRMIISSDDYRMKNPKKKNLFITSHSMSNSFSVPVVYVTFTTDFMLCAWLYIVDKRVHFSEGWIWSFIITKHKSRTDV